MWLVAVAAALCVAGGGPALAQDEVDCGATGIDFDLGSTALGLEAQASLSDAAGWTLLETGRYVLVSPNAGTTPSEARLAGVRAAVVAHYLLTLGVPPNLVSVVPAEGVTPSRRYALGYRAAVIVMTCFGVPSGP